MLTERRGFFYERLITAKVVNILEVFTPYSVGGELSVFRACAHRLVSSALCSRDYSIVGDEEAPGVL